MTPSIVIEKINRLKPNALQEPDIIDFINEVERDIAFNILGVPFTPVEDKNAELLAPGPYGNVYFDYISGKIDLINGNVESYSLSAAQFNTTMAELRAYCIRTYPRASTRRSDYF